MALNLPSKRDSPGFVGKEWKHEKKLLWLPYNHFDSVVKIKVSVGKSIKM
jgi:hypothetical protein